LKVAIIGYGKMGQQIAHKLAFYKHEVAVYDLNAAQLEITNDSAITPFANINEVINFFESDRVVIWLMIPSVAVESEIENWVPLLKPTSIIIDGGNSNFKESITRAEKLAPKGIGFIDIGTSGGILGSAEGFSMMVGGNEEDYKFIEPLLDSLSQPSGSFNYFGPSGSGHFIKMVHNAIEYGYMESLAEGYQLIHEGPFKDIDLVNVSEVWEKGSIISSKLNSLSGQVFKNNPNLNGVNGVVEQTGEASWAIDFAKSIDLDLPSIEAALNVRLASKNGKVSFATKLLAELRNKFGGHNINNK